MKFSDMKYTRPHMDTLKAAAYKAAAEIKSAVSALPHDAVETPSINLSILPLRI